MRRLLYYSLLLALLFSFILYIFNSVMELDIKNLEKQRAAVELAAETEKFKYFEALNAIQKDKERVYFEALQEIQSQINKEWYKDGN